MKICGDTGEDRCARTCRDVNRSRSVRLIQSKLPKFEMIFLKKIINKVSSQAIFRIGYLSAISDRTSTEVKNAQV